MTNKELAEQKSFLSLDTKDFSHENAKEAFAELFECINYFLGTLWFRLFVSRSETADYVKQLPNLSIAITSKYDTHQQFGLGMTNHELETRFVSGMKTASPATLTSIIAIMDVYLTEVLDGDIKSAQNDALELWLQEHIKHRRRNKFDMKLYVLKTQPKFETIAQEAMPFLQRLAEMMDLRHRYLHRKKEDAFIIDHETVSEAWFLAVKLVQLFDKHLP